YRTLVPQSIKPRIFVFNFFIQNEYIEKLNLDKFSIFKFFYESIFTISAKFLLIKKIKSQYHKIKLSVFGN
ncbi:hypothetical protein BpHYR1_053073, partial [Brachionus plicatilis]